MPVFSPQATISVGGNLAARDVIVQSFTAGIEALATDYTVRCANFLSEYLGTAERPVPFGGRDRELQALDGWLSDSAAPPYLLLASPAGRGKSALLVQWLRRLKANPNVDAAFVPISIRFRTNRENVVFAILAARLAKLTNRELPHVFGPSPEEWRGVVSGYLANADPKRKPVVLIIDSLDEAADWQSGPDLFPLQPPTGLRVVVSTRLLAGQADAGAWLERLGWTRPGLARTLELPPLDEAGIGELLRDAHLLGPELVSQLHRLTQGDPLLLGLYIKHLTKPQVGAAPLHQQDLPALAPGLQGYMTLWWEEQRQLWGEQAGRHEPAIKSFLSLLAGALGPLNRDDLLALDPALETWVLDDVLPSVQRIVLGDGVRQGFAYGHPRLGAFMLDRLTPTEKQKLDQQFLQWGADVLSSLQNDGAAPKAAPAYLSQQYSTHLLRAEKHKELFALVGTRAWFDAQEAADPSLSTFFNDVSRAWLAAEAVNTASIKDGHECGALHQEVRCALATASIRSLSFNYPASVLVALAKTGRWTKEQALQAARRNPDPAARAEALSCLADLLSSESEQTAVLREALKSLRELGNTSVYPDLRTALEGLAHRLKTSPLVGEALDIARTDLHGRDRAAALAKLLGYLPASEQSEILHEVLALLRDLPDSWEGESAWALALIQDVVPNLPNNFREAVVTEALASAKESVRGGNLAISIAGLAPFMTEPEKSNVLRDGLAAVEDEGWSQGQSQALQALAPMLPDALLRHALDLAKGSWIPDLETLAALAPHLPAPLVMEALEEAKTLEESYFSFEARGALALRLAEIGRPDLALAEWERIEYTGWPTEMKRAGLAPRLAENVGPEEGLRFARNMSTDWGRFNAWSGLAAVLPEHLRHQAIEEAISAAKSDAVRTLLADGAAREAQEAVAELAIRAGEKGFFREALELVRVLPQRDSHGKRVRVNALAELLSTADDESRDTVLEQALRAARSINDYAEQALALAPLGGSLPADERRDVHAAALVAAHEITSPRNCAEVLVRAIPFLSGTQMQEAVLRAVTCLDEVEGSEFFRISSMLSRSLAPDVAATLIETKIMAAPKDEGEEAIQSALIRMFSNALSGPLLMKASKRALGCQNTRRRIQTLACLLPRLPLEAKIEFLSLMVRDVAKMAGVDGSDSRLQAALFKQIAPHLEEAVLDEAKAAVELLASDETGHRRALEALAPALARLGHGHEALEIVRACAAIDAYEGSPRANLFKQIVPHLEEAVLDEAKAVVESLTSSEEGYMEALAALALQLARLGRGHDALEAVRAIDWEWKRGEALAAVIPHLPSPLLPTARELLDDLGFKPGSTVRRASVVAIVKRCPDHEMTTLLSEALAAIATPDAWNAEHDYTDSLPVLTSRLTPSIVHGAIVLVRERSDGALALAILAGLLPESERSALFAEAVATAEQIDDPDDRAEALGKMSKYLPEALLGRVLEGIRAVGKSKYIGLSTRAEALANLVPRLVRQPVRTLDPMFRDTLHVLANHGRPELLWDLAALPSLLSKLGGVEAVSKVAREVIDATRRWP